MTDNYTSMWAALAQDSSKFEQSMDPLHRKQTGSYYTSLELTYSMMQEMVDSLPETEKDFIYKKTFLEPCVGTGNFVYAYLNVCKSLNLTSEQYKELVNNIYVCDINSDALEVYKRNLSRYVQNLFQISLEDDYFSTHVGTGLMIDVDAAATRYIPVTDVFPPEIVKNGFDFVVTNPPYKNLKAERGHYQSISQYNSDKAKYAKIGKLAAKQFPFSSVGPLNLYKLFVEEIIERYTSPKGVCSLLIPASILSDKTCSKLRTRILGTCSLKSLRIIAETSNYVDASQALCAMLLVKSGTTSSVYIDGSFSGNIHNGTIVSVKDFLDSSIGNAILVLSPEEYSIRQKMQKFPTIKDIPYIFNLRGELDITINKSFITSKETPYTLYRGRHVGYYYINEDSRLSTKEYVETAFVHSTAKRRFIHKQRLICQQIANMAKKRRISFTLVPSESVLANSCNFIAIDPNPDGVDYYFLMGVLNSQLIDWFFKLTSSNNHINNYEIDNFPIPIHYVGKAKISELVRQYLEFPNEKLLAHIEELVKEAYGIPPAEKKEVKYTKKDEQLHPKTLFNDQSIILQRLAQDIHQFIPNITDDICRDVLAGKLSLQDVYNESNVILDSFNQKVVENIEKKYRKLSDLEVLNHTTFKLSNLDLEMIKPVPQGGSWKDIPPETVQKSKRLARISQTGGRTTLYGRIDYNKPSYTITTYFNRPGNGTYVHPVHERVLSVREAARFQSFPDEYLFCGNQTEMLKQVGNAVPVLLAYNIGKSIKNKTGCATSVDLFSGAGGMTYGFKLAGIKAVIANDIVEAACITLKTNNPEIPVLCGDITNEETKSTIISAGIQGNADIICGGPPCQGFSLAGYRMKDDPRNQLFKHFVDIVSGVNPKVIVFENVEGILSYQGGETYRNIIELFSELGYYTEGRTLMANHYGVPQRRKRVIILCTRKDLGVLPADLFPSPITPNIDHQVTAHDTISDLENVPCSEHAVYASKYSSPILKFLKGEISADDYLDDIKKTRCNLPKPSQRVTVKNSESGKERVSVDKSVQKGILFSKSETVTPKIEFQQLNFSYFTNK